MNTIVIDSNIYKGAESYAKMHNISVTAAIEKAISMSKTGDIVAIFGKGAEKTQEIKGVKYAYNDRDVIRDITGV